MLRPFSGLSESDLERALLRKGVDSRDARSPRCAECGRQPLIGESIHRYERDAVCELCRPRRRAEPLRTHLVLHLEHGLASAGSPPERVSRRLTASSVARLRMQASLPASLPGDLIPRSVADPVAVRVA